MTRIEFFFNVPNKSHKVAELCEKAYAKGRKLTVIAETAQQSEQIRQLLWTQTPTGFLPNCSLSHQLAAETAIHVDHQTEALQHDDILISLRNNQLPFFARYTRLIELVGLDEEDKMQARIRFKHYRDSGYEIKTYDVSGAAL